MMVLMNRKLLILILVGDRWSVNGGPRRSLAAES
jgi:hypothetical protein